MAYTRPGVYVTESPFRTNVARTNNAAVAAFLGTAERGPTTPTLVDSWGVFKTQFGDLAQDHDLGFAVYHYFANGGRVAYVSRVAGASATSASTAGLTYLATELASPATLTELTAKSSGAWGNGLTVSLSSGKVAPTATQIPTFNLTVTLDGTTVEEWSELSADPTSSRFIDAILNDYSAYIGAANTATVTAASGFSYVVDSVGFAEGSDGAAVASGDYVAALTGLDDVDGALIINCPGRYDAATVNGALSYAEARGDSFVVIDPDPTATTSGAILSSVAYNKSGYGAVYYPMLKMIDPSKTGPAAIRVTAPGGAIVGAFVRTDAQRSVAKTPAGYDVEIKNALGLATPMTDAIVSAVYDSGVNCLKAIPGAGIVVLGGRTLQTVRPDQYISVRRSLNYVKSGAKDLTRFAVFEPNNEALWSQIETRINQFLTNFWGVGGLKGNSPSEAFYVVCDETNNTATTIDNGEVHIEIGLALQYPAEFIVINVSQWIGGATTAETL